MVGEIGLSSRSRFDRGLRYSSFLIETLSITGQHFLSVLKIAATVYKRDYCAAGSKGHRRYLPPACRKS